NSRVIRVIASLRALLPCHARVITVSCPPGQSLGAGLPPALVHGTFWLPAEVAKDGTDAPLNLGVEPVDRRCKLSLHDRLVGCEAEYLDCDVDHGCSREIARLCFDSVIDQSVEMFFDQRLPDIWLVTALLLRRDVLAFELRDRATNAPSRCSDARLRRRAGRERDLARRV